MKSQEEMQSKIARLESQVDLLESELIYFDTLLRRCGFPMGMRTLKATVEEILEEVEDEWGFDEQPPSAFM